MDKKLRIYALLRLGVDIADTDTQLLIWDWLTRNNITYDWDTSKLKLMITFDFLSDLTGFEEFLQTEIQNKYTAMLDVSADIPDDKFAEEQMTYRLIFNVGLTKETKQMLIKLFPAEHLIN